MNQEIKILAGRCKCKRKLDLRITDVREDEDNPMSKVIAWLIFGVCNRCKLVIMEAMFQQENEPMLGVDFIIDEDKIVKYSKKSSKVIYDGSYKIRT